MKRISLIYITYDGVLNTMCGVGAITRTFIDSFTEVRNILLKYDIDLVLNLLTIALTDEADGFNKNILMGSINVAKNSGGDVYYVINDSLGDNQFGTKENWKVASISAATKALELAQGYDETLLYCVDTPFLHVPYYVNRQIAAYDNKNIKSLIVLHSDVLIHHPDNPDPDRLNWEKTAIERAFSDNNIYFAKTSEFLMNHVRKNYRIDEQRIINLQTGVLPTDKKYAHHSENEVAEKLVEYNIPVDKDIIFSLGRAVEYKGFELLLEAVSKLEWDFHLVFIASAYNDRFCNVQELKQIINKYNIPCTPIFKLDFELPKFICQWKNTKVVAQLAKHEPFGLVPEDVRMWARKVGPINLASSREGFLEQIDNGKDGFLVDIKNVDEITDKILNVLSLPDDRINEIRGNGYARAVRDYDYRISILRSVFELMGKKCPNSAIEEFSYDNLL